MEEKVVSLELLLAEAVDIITVLDKLPTESNAWPLVQKLKNQVNAQTQPDEDSAPEQEAA